MFLLPESFRECPLRKSFNQAAAAPAYPEICMADNSRRQIWFLLPESL